METKEQKFDEMKSHSMDFVKSGTNMMEPYRRLLERRWDNIQIKMKELEYALRSHKEQKGEQPVDEGVTMTKMIAVQSSAPDSSSDDLWWSTDEVVPHKNIGNKLVTIMIQTSCPEV